MTTETPVAWAALPKAELHVHLEAAMRPSTAAELAARHGLPAVRQGPYRGQADFVVAYESARDLVVDLGDLNRIAAEAVADAAPAGVRWTEMHCVPHNYGGRLGAPEAVVEAVLDGLGAPGRAGLVLAHNRARGPAAAWQALDLALRYQDRGVVGFGLVGNEADHPPEQYAEVFAAARRAGLRSVPHAGEGAGPWSVRSAWRALGADRIAHGVRAVEDPGLVEELADADVCLDVCPSSNVALGASPSLRDHQLPALLAAGVPVSLGSDGRLFFGVDVADEYRYAHEGMGVDTAALARIARASLDHSAAPHHLIRAVHRDIDTWVATHAP
ncbi:adenosine deaminase [Actinomadura vinacea]|uniref:Adenosine deaminase n=1 Tax=Actinomadura vinacea TaxID=115336 RepID=A0ABP5WRF8_9ACTN